LTCSPFVIPGAIARSIVRIESGGAIAFPHSSSFSQV
jgi:hypothetical protein